MQGEEVFQTLLLEWAWFSQGDRVEKKEEKTWRCTVDPKIRIKIWLGPLNLPTIRFIYPKILKAFPQTFLTDINPTNKYPAQEKKWGKKRERRGEERKQEENSILDCCFTFKIISKFCLLCMPVVQKLLFCIWRRVKYEGHLV